MIEWSKSFKKYRIKVVERAGTPLRNWEQKTSVRGKDASHVSSLVKGRNLSARKGAFCTKTSAIQELFHTIYVGERSTGEGSGRAEMTPTYSNITSSTMEEEEGSQPSIYEAGEGI